MDAAFDSAWLTRLLLERGIAAIYLIAFAAAFEQFPALLGERGLLPVPEFIHAAPFRRFPSAFFWRYSDRLLRCAVVIGAAFSAAILFGASTMLPWWALCAMWLTIWAIYLSIVNVGQAFYSFGWETMTLEAGFFAAFLGSAGEHAPMIPILALRWMLFRVEVGSGLIKLRHDKSWRDLTALWYHYETQPLPNPLSWYFHRLPKPLHRAAVLGSHVVQTLVPFGLFAPQPFASIAGAAIIFHQFWLIVSGNYSWLNWITVVLGLSAFSDATLLWLPGTHVPESLAPLSTFHQIALFALGAATLWLSIAPARNLLSPHQVMNHSFNRLHLVNAYGAFGSITKIRYEVIIEGTDSDSPSADAEWREYRFRAKPGDPLRMPPQVAPYHLRLDWLMWFLPFSVVVRPHNIIVPDYEDWFLGLIAKLLKNDRATLKLMGPNPFPDGPPKFIRARYFRYEYTSRQKRKATAAWWKRSFVGLYLPPVSPSDLAPT